MGGAIVGAALGAAFSTGAAAFAGSLIGGSIFATFAASFALNIVKGALTGALAGGQDGGGNGLQQSINNRTFNIREPVSSRKIAYGRLRVGGPIVFVHVSENASVENQFFNMFIAHSIGPCEEIEHYWFNDTIISLSNAKEVENRKFSQTHTIEGPAQTAPVAWVYTKLGSAAQTADTEAIANTEGKITSDHKLQGICYSYVHLKSFDNVWPNGPPKLSVTMKGKNDIYDPRTGSATYTANAALILRDYLTNSDYGLGIASGAIDDTNFAEAASVCDEVVTLVNDISGGDLSDNNRDDDSAVADYDNDNPSYDGASGTIRSSEARYEFNGWIDTANGHETNITEILKSMGGRLVKSGDKWKVFPAKWYSAVDTINSADMAGPLKIKVLSGRAALYNQVKGVYLDEKQAWQASEYPVVNLTEYQSAGADNEVLPSFLDFEGVASHGQAQRLAGIHAARGRREMLVEMSLKLHKMGLEVNDTIKVNNSAMGWTDKEFEVLEWRFSPQPQDGGAPSLTYDVLLAETDSAIYAWNPATDEKAPSPAVRTNLGDPFMIGNAPSGLTASSGENYLIKKGDGTILSRIKVSWDTPANGFIEDAVIDWRKSGATSYTDTMTVNASLGATFITNVDDGSAYDIRMRFRNYFRNFSPETEIEHTVIGKTSPPDDVTSFTVIGGQGFGNFTWERVSNLDAAGYEIRYGTQNATTWETAQLIDLVAAGKNEAKFNVPPGSWTFYIKAIDTTGNKSVNAKATNATITTDFASVAVQLDSALDQGTYFRTIRMPNGVIIPISRVPMTYYSANDWTWIDNFVHLPVPSASYTSEEVDLGFDDTVRVWMQADNSPIPGQGGDPNHHFELCARLEGEVTANGADGVQILRPNGTFTDCVMRFDYKLIPESELTLGAYLSADASSWAWLDNLPHDTALNWTYTSPEFDLGAQKTYNAVKATSERLHQGKTGAANATYRLDYRSAAGSYDGYEQWEINTFEGRYVKFQITGSNTTGVTVTGPTEYSLDCFNEFDIGLATGRYFTPKLVIKNDDSDSVHYYDSLDMHIEAPNVVQGAGSVALSAGTNVISYSPRYHTAPILVTTARGTNRFVDIVSNSATAFSIVIRDQNNSAVAGTLDWEANGT